MNKRLYSTLSSQGIKKQPQLYYPFLLLGISISSILFILHSLATNTQLDKIRGGEQLRMLLNFGVWVVVIFSVIIFFYGNSIIAKKRNKEIGIYSVLGMERRHISKIVLLQHFKMFLINMVAGLLLGIVMTQLALLLLLKMLNVEMRFFAGINLNSIFLTAGIFFALYLVTALYSLFKINTAYPISLLSSDDEGEKPPKARWLLALIGFACLGTGYYMALTIKDPVVAMLFFFIAVILVIIGTYALFTFGSTVILNVLSKNKSFYYKSNNFISVSGMKYRLRQNAAGLASICILSTCVLVILSTTFSMYIGVEDLLKSRYPKDMSIWVTEFDDKKIQQIDEIIDEDIDKYQLKQERVNKYFMLPYIDSIETYETVVRGKVFITLDEYNRLTGENYTLGNNEVLAGLLDKGEIPSSIEMGGTKYKVKQNVKVPDVYVPISMGYDMEIAVICVVVKNQDIAIDYVNSESDEGIGQKTNFNYYYNFDLQGSKKNRESFGIDTRASLMELEYTRSENIDEGRESFYVLHGGLLFLGVFLGIIFLIATTIIIYYKQISEGHQDKRRFTIMKNVGMSTQEVKKAIRVQVLQVFFLPLLMAMLHISFAFPMISRILKLLNLTNISLFAVCTIIVTILFSVFYAIFYHQTSKAYYKIISQDEIV